MGGTLVLAKHHVRFVESEGIHGHGPRRHRGRRGAAREFANQTGFLLFRPVVALDGFEATRQIHSLVENHHSRYAGLLTSKVAASYEEEWSIATEKLSRAEPVALADTSPA